MKLVTNYNKLYILKVVKNYVMVLNLYSSGWIYIVCKSLTYGCLNNLSQLRMYWDSYLKVVESRGHVRTQVQGSSISCTYS
jgi:hypothetical protein